MGSPPGLLTLLWTAGGAGKLRVRGNISGLRDRQVGGGDSAPLGSGRVPKCYWQGCYGRGNWAMDAGHSAGEETGFIMRDLLFVLVYLAMVLTPAVVALRSGRENGNDE